MPKDKAGIIIQKIICLIEAWNEAISQKRKYHEMICHGIFL